MDVDTVATDVSRNTQLLGAVKFTGQSGKLRYGTLVAAEDETRIFGTQEDGSEVAIDAVGRDFFVGRLLYEDTNAGGRRGYWLDGYKSIPS